MKKIVAVSSPDTDIQERTTLDKLPNLVLIKVLELLPPEDRRDFAHTCTTAYEAFQNKYRGASVIPRLNYKNEDEFQKQIKGTPLKLEIPGHTIASALNYLIENPNLTGQILYCDNGAHLNSSEK